MGFPPRAPRTSTSTSLIRLFPRLLLRRMDNSLAREVGPFALRIQIPKKEIHGKDSSGCLLFSTAGIHLKWSWFDDFLSFFSYAWMMSQDSDRIPGAEDEDRGASGPKEKAYMPVSKDDPHYNMTHPKRGKAVIFNFDHWVGRLKDALDLRLSDFGRIF